MHETFVLEVLFHLGFDGDEIADHVGVREHDSFRLSGGTGGEDDFERVGGVNRRGTKALRTMVGDGGFEFGGIDGRVFRWYKRVENGGPLARTENQFRAHLRADSARKVGNRRVVDGNGDDSAEGAAEECSHPFSRVRTP